MIGAWLYTIWFYLYDVAINQLTELFICMALGALVTSSIALCYAVGTVAERLFQLTAAVLSFRESR
jgi:hypothetical protein